MDCPGNNSNNKNININGNGNNIKSVILFLAKQKSQKTSNGREADCFLHLIFFGRKKNCFWTRNESFWTTWQSIFNSNFCPNRLPSVLLSFWWGNDLSPWPYHGHLPLPLGQGVILPLKWIVVLINNSAARYVWISSLSLSHFVRSDETVRSNLGCWASWAALIMPSKKIDMKEHLK